MKIKITLVLFIFSFYLKANGLFYSSGQEDGKSYSKVSDRNVRKVKCDEEFPEIIFPGQHLGLYLGECKENLFLEIAFIRSGDKESSVSIRYNNQKLFKDNLKTSYRILRLPIPAFYHETEENILDIFNTGINPIGIDYIRLSKFDFKKLPELKFALGKPEKVPKAVRKYFHYAWFYPGDDKEIKDAKVTASKGRFKPIFFFDDYYKFKKRTKGRPFSYDTVFSETPDIPGDLGIASFRSLKKLGSFNLSSGVLDREIPGRIKKSLQDDGGKFSFSAVLNYHISETENFDDKDAYNLVSSILEAASNKCHTILLDNKRFGNVGFFFDKYSKPKPAYYQLSYISKLFGAKSRFLACIINNTTNDPMKPFHHCASVEGNSVTFISLSRAKEKLNLTLLLPWNGKTVIEELHSSLPDERTPEPDTRFDNVTPSGIGGIYDLELPPAKFHFIRLRREGTKLPQLTKTDSLSDQRPDRIQLSRITVNNNIFTGRSSYVFTTARTVNGSISGFGNLKDKITWETQLATPDTFDKMKDLVPEEKYSTFVSFPSKKAQTDEKRGLDFAIKSVSMPSKLKGLGFWIYFHSADNKRQLLTFEYGTKRFNHVLKPNFWDYCILPIKEVKSSYFRVLYPSSKSDTELEFNGFRWLSEENEKGESNSVTNCVIVKPKGKKQVDIRLSGSSGGYCEIRRRIGLDFVPNKIALAESKTFKEKPELKATYFKHSGILSIKGKLPVLEEKDKPMRIEIQMTQED